MNTSAATRRWGGRLAGLAVSLIAIVIVISAVDIGATLDVLSRTDPAYIVLALALIPLQVILRGWRWRMLLPHRPDGSPVPVRRTISPMLVGYLGNNVLPARLGEAIRSFLVARRERLVPLVAFGATMLERLIDVVALALIGLAAALLLGAEWWIVAVGLAAGVGGAVVLALLVTLGFTRFVDLGRWVLERVHLAVRLERLLDWAGAFAAGVDRGRDVPRLVGAIGVSFLAWVVDASIFYFVGLALGIELGLAQAALIGAVAVLATAIPAAPGYVGTFELAATSTAVALGIPREEALAMAVMVHMVTLIPVAVAGAIVLLTSGASLGTIASQAESAEEPHPHAERAPLPVG
ncbi:MAG: lysylphosphatidylglycerol synthase transmembrane domain-containing protein [Candidatus Limnocylindrales bacterium]